MLGVLFIAALLILTRLYFVQIVHGEEYAQKADRQFASGGTGLFDRGSIYFTRKDGTLISAATLATGFLVAVNPQVLENPEAAYEAVSRVAPDAFDKESFLTAAGKRSRVYIEVAHHLSEEEGEAVAALDLPGVDVLRERWRYYPGGALASQSLGIVSYGSGDTLAGRTGLEGFYDTALARSGDALYKNFFAELFSNVGNLLVSARDAREGDLVTTIEPEVQTRLSDELREITRHYGSKESGGIIMDPATGAIIALATYPTYDANDRTGVTPKLLGNPLVEHVYEFGSTMKILTMAAGLDSGTITVDSTYEDTGCLKVNASTICNHDGKARGTTGMQEVLSHSLNLGVAWIATEMGQESFRNYFMNLFGQKTGIDLPGETKALTANLSSKEQVNYDTIAYGQGLAATPVQMIRALGALANGGAMVQPHLVSGIELNTGIVRPLDWEGRTQVFSPEAARQVSTMLTELTDEVLSNGKARIPTMSVAAKTGTAQLTDGKGGYHKDRYFHSFTGYFPSYAPRFIILLYTNDPQGVQYASETLTPTFMDLTHFLIDYYAIPPDRGVATTTQP